MVTCTDGRIQTCHQNYFLSTQAKVFWIVVAWDTLPTDGIMLFLRTKLGLYGKSGLKIGCDPCVDLLEVLYLEMVLAKAGEQTFPSYYCDFC